MIRKFCMYVEPALSILMFCIQKKMTIGSCDLQV